MENLLDFLAERVTDSRDLEEVTLKDEDVRFSLPAELSAAGQRLHSIASSYEPPQHLIETADALAAGASQAAQRASDALLSLQNEQGYWWAYLTADTTLESDYILLQLWLDPPQDGVWESEEPHVDRQSGAVDPAAAARGRRL